VSGANAFHPLVRPTAERVGIRWSRRVGYDQGALGQILALAAQPDWEGLVLACSDDEGDSTAVVLTPEDAADLRDALSSWLEEQ